MVWWCWSSTDVTDDVNVTDDVTNSDGPTTLSPIPISANLSVSGYEYNSFRLPYLIRALLTIVQFHNVEYNGF